ncbi:hypothetical protein D3C86_1624470 [compost metagenome]
MIGVGIIGCINHQARQLTDAARAVCTAPYFNTIYGKLIQLKVQIKIYSTTLALYTKLQQTVCTHSIFSEPGILIIATRGGSIKDICTLCSRSNTSIAQTGTQRPGASFSVLSRPVVLKLHDGTEGS